ncbi:MAG: CoA activase [Bryobacteraceae bacterium]|nr:CoA activase [Bryobacteraceae bacterium]
MRIGLDIGSTTVKAVVQNHHGETVWKDYARHDSRQAEKALEFFGRWEEEIPGFRPAEARVFATGSGGATVGERIGAKFIQEVHAVSLAVERLYPQCGTVIELGGQDAKIIIFQEATGDGPRRKLPSMNDKCAGGTGAVIDKIRAKLGIPAGELATLGYDGLKLHTVAGKCGVFAETDINGLQKSGIPPAELMASLYEAIVIQNLTVLTRGNTPRPDVLLLGGPNTFLRGLRECWRAHLLRLWRERGVTLPEGGADRCIITPDGSEYFAALGALEAGLQEAESVGCYRGSAELRDSLRTRAAGKSGGGLSRDAADLHRFRERYRPPVFAPAVFAPGQIVEGFIGIDGGSTSSKAVLIGRDPQRPVLAKAYQLSQGNPIEDTQQVLARLAGEVARQGATLRVLGAGVTGYAKDLLRDVVGADAALVETVAHTQAGLHFFPDVDVICDVGGQDIKLIMLKNGAVKDFRLNTQCSAGNGYFLQSTAEALGYRVEQLAEVAFQAQAMPEFGYGCAVFMQSDIVNFQRQGWTPEEILAGLCNVLPKNIWLYVAQIPNLAALGKRFLLQGGTQYNLAAVKAQVDFIESRFRGTAAPEVVVHPFCGEAGAIGAALEAGRLFDRGRQTTFTGLGAVRELRYTATTSEDTRCYFCPNHCLRTFIDVASTGAPATAKAPAKTKVPLAAGAQRLILATCEKGTVEDVEAMREIKSDGDQKRQRYPNLAEHAAHAAFRVPAVPVVADPISRWALTPAQTRRQPRQAARQSLRVGMPRVLNLYSLAPLFNGYFAALGIPPGNLVWSDFTSEELYRNGAKRGAVDPCFPSKLGIPHVHNLLEVQHARRPLNVIFFPMIDCLPTFLRGVQDSRACPTVTATPAGVKAAFTREQDLFAAQGIQFLNPLLDPGLPDLLERQMFEAFADLLGLSAAEHRRALACGWEALAAFDGDLRSRASAILATLEREERLGVVLLGRPYHNDPGVNHGILEEFQKLGYPILTQDEATLQKIFVPEEWADARGVADVWKNSYSENTSRKVWGAKFVARHPNLIAVELSNFKCGHDAPIYSLVEEIIESAGKPFFSFRDIDENRPAGAIRIRTETIHYFLTRYQERLRNPRTAEAAPLGLSLRITLNDPPPAIHVTLDALLSSLRPAQASRAAPPVSESRPKVLSAADGGSRS